MPSGGHPVVHPRLHGSQATLEQVSLKALSVFPARCSIVAPSINWPAAHYHILVTWHLAGRLVFYLRTVPVVERLGGY